MAAFFMKDNELSITHLMVTQSGEDVYLEEDSDIPQPGVCETTQEDYEAYFSSLMRVVMSPTTARRIARDLISAADKAERVG